MALINFYKGLKENYSPDTHGNSIYSCTDTNECYILGVLYENISEEEITNKIGTNTYTGANYISKEANLTDAAMQLDEEIKATNDNIDILNAATVKGVATISASNKVEVQNGIAVIPLLSDNNPGVLDVSYYRFINNGYNANIPILGSNSSGDYIFAGYKDDNGLRLPITSTLDPDTTEYLYIMYANESNGGLMSSTDYEKLNNIENTYLPLTGGTITGVVRHSANIDLDNSKYIEAYTTGGQQYPVLFIDSGDDFVVGSNGIETRIRSNDTDLIHDTTSGRYTIYDSHNLDITKWNISQLTTSVDNVTSSGIKYYNTSDGDIENLPTEDSSYGIVSTFAQLYNNNPGTNNTWGFQLISPNNSDSLWYRNFKGLSKNSWKELATVDQINTQPIIINADSNLPADPTRAALFTKLQDEPYHNIVLQRTEGNYYPISSSGMLKSITFNYVMDSSGSLAIRSLILNKDGSTISS